MKNILIIQNKILHYRKALYNELAKHYNITIIHSGKKSKSEGDIYDEIITHASKILFFQVQKGVLKEVNSGKYDIVIAMCDLHWVNNILAFYRHPSSVKFIWWGSWFTNNYISNIIKTRIAQGADANIYYTKEARNSFIKKGVLSRNLFIANNTFDVGKRILSYKSKIKNSILFVGSLEKRKEIEILIKAFYKIRNNINTSFNLVLIGDGGEKQSLINLTNSLNLKDRVFFEGQIENVDKLRHYYYKSIVSVSFGQAGLSVLQSFGYGVPFITKLNAISGGEKTNIINGHNGFFCDDNIKSLSDLLMMLCQDVELARSLGKNAYDYYSDFGTISNMALGFVDAIDYTILN